MSALQDLLNTYRQGCAVGVRPFRCGPFQASLSA